MEAAIGIEPMDKGFADLCLTTWLRRPNIKQKISNKRRRLFSRGMLESRPSPLELWSGRRDLNPRLRPWQGRTLPLSYSRSANLIISARNYSCQPKGPLSANRSWQLFRKTLTLSDL